MHAAGRTGDPGSEGPRSAAVWVSADGTTRVYTRRFRTFFAGLVLFAGLAASGGPTRAIAADDVSTARFFGWVTLALALWTAFRFMRMAVVVTPGHITLRGFLRTLTVPATDIARFEPPPYERSTPHHSGLRVILTSGETLSAGVFHVGDEDLDGIGVAETAELNLWLALQRSPVAVAPRLPTEYRLTGAAAIAWNAWLGFLGVLLVVAVVRGAALVTLDEGAAADLGVLQSVGGGPFPTPPFP